jgi:hypothetical protein
VCNCTQDSQGPINYFALAWQKFSAYSDNKRNDFQVWIFQRLRIYSIFENNLEYESGGREGTFDEKKQNWKIRCKCTVLYLKGTVQRDFLPLFFSQIDFSQAPYSVFKDFSNLASNSRRYSRFLIDSPLLFIAESRYSLHCLIRRVATLRFIIAGSHCLLGLSA